MRICFAPMEGITDDLFRRAHHRFYGGADRYYTPVLSPSQGRVFSGKELREVLPENNRGIRLVPQLLTSRADLFTAGAKKLKELGYTEVNLNLGCPSGTVTAKGRGAGMLFPERRQALKAFLDEIFADCPLDISIKTRLGKEDPAEFAELLELYQNYPVRELIIHPRVQKDLYRKPVWMETFFQAAKETTIPVCLSGGIATEEDFHRVFAGRDLPEAVMLGRGLVADPALARKLRGGTGTDRETLRQFHDALFEETLDRLGSIKYTIFRMKELWHYFILLFDGREKYRRMLQKAASQTEYQAAVARIFAELPLRDAAEPDWP